MKLQAPFATFALDAVVSLTGAPVHAQEACPSFLCMAGLTQGQGIVECCTSPVQSFFSPSLYIYDEEGIDWPATALNRMRFLLQCQPGTAGANSGIVLTIITDYGMKAAPF